MKKELEIYIHIPFCVQKCKYCDFLSGPESAETKDRYMEALCQEICIRSSEYQEYHISSIFIGGGTPTCVDPKWIQKLMQLIMESFHVDPDAEISMEMNPGTVDRQALEIYHKSGINRLSIGLQSARMEELAVLGRIHSYEQFLEAYFTAREIGFLNINVDLMSGLPMQTTADYLESLEKVTSLVPPPDHISAYSLIIEEGTPFGDAYEKQQLQLPDEETDRAMYEITREFLAQKGYERYEISNYAKKGYACKHNVGYWQRKNYIGFGIGAASLVENVRFSNDDKLSAYVKDPLGCRVNEEQLTKQEQMEETMFLGLRMAAGVSKKQFQELYGRTMREVYGDVIRRHITDGLLQEDEEYVRLTLKGMDVSNYVMSDFLEP